MVSERGARAHGGIFVFSWALVRVDGAPAPDLTSLRRGQGFEWDGEAIRVDGPANILPLGEAMGEGALRRRAARSLGREADEAALAGIEPDAPPAPEQSLELTDGHQRWRAVILPAGPSRPALLQFTGALPPRRRELWIVSIRLAPGAAARPGGVVCFTPGTLIATEDGPRPVETLREGARIQTRDNGCQPLLWLGTRRITGARIAAMPWLAPVRLRPHALGKGVPDPGLTVSPDHRILLRGARARSLFGAEEVLVAAADLIDDRLILRDRSRREVTYIHLLLPAHEIVFANGVETESFHPAAAAAEDLEPFDVQLPDAADYGPYARRVLTSSEAAILAHA
ncbi:Hint domain-containing protein [Pseudoroseicyclus sp. CXY001]|uniref:Hint domain-containing protein n=1 Tax=Pseudoroseicyclus sp. CXY001 TaxID=3242492 RepID=UPI0035711F81